MLGWESVFFTRLLSHLPAFHAGAFRIGRVVSASARAADWLTAFTLQCLIEPVDCVFQGLVCLWIVEGFDYHLGGVLEIGERFSHWTPSVRALPCGGQAGDSSGGDGSDIPCRRRRCG